MDNYRPVWAEVNLGALKRNLEHIRSYTKSEIMPIVKADAYGHGALEVVRALKAQGIKRFGVAFLEEALELRAVFPDIILMIIGPTLAQYSDILVKEEIIPEVFQYEQAEALSAAAVRLGKVARLHIKVDTGMGRIGFRDNAFDEIKRISGLPGLYIEGIYTHLATADSEDLAYARAQLESFDSLYNRLAEAGIHIAIRHAANSPALMQMPQSHYELCRPGIILYGPLPLSHTGQNGGLEPVMSLKARISQVKTIEAGHSVGYGRTFIAAGPTTVATLPLGYADGLCRSLSNTGQVIIRGRKAKIIGKVCMDQTMIDMTGIADVESGELVTIMGRDGTEEITADEIARYSDTISYEVLCGISKRVRRVYVDN